MSFFTNKIDWKSKRGKAIIALISLSVLLPLIGDYLSKRKYPSLRQAYEACQAWKANAVSVEIDYSAEQKRKERKLEDERKRMEQKRREEEAKKRIMEEANSLPSLPASQNGFDDFDGLELPYISEREMLNMDNVPNIIRKCEPENVTRQVIGLEMKPTKKGKVLTSDEWNAQSDKLYATKNFR